MNQPHAPTPWKWTDYDIEDADGNTVVGVGNDGACSDEECCPGGPSPILELHGKDARFIVQCVNTHKELLAIVQKIETILTPPADQDGNIDIRRIVDGLCGILPTIRQALAKAEEEPKK